MDRREFMAAVAAAGLVSSTPAAAAPFPFRFRRPSPYEALLRFVEPGADEFSGEAAAQALEARLGRIFDGREAAPPGLAPWVGRLGRIRSARFYALPRERVRYEIRLDGEYHTGVWQLPAFTVLESDTAASAKPYFRDVTGHVFGGVPSFRDQLLIGNPAWRARLDSACGIDVYGNQGLAVGDIDNDGMDEIYVCQAGGLPNRLYKIGADGRARDITVASGLDLLDETTCALFADFRNSGHQDIVVLRSSGPLLFFNRGNGVFEQQPDAFRFRSAPQGSFTGMAAADYNRDGFLDLYLCSYVYFQSEDQYQYPAPYNDATNGPPNFLFRNRLMEPNGGFEDVTTETGMDHNNDRFSFAPAWCDYDGDGWPDLYVANDFGRNNLYRNREGRFSDEARAAGVEDMGPGMSASWFDYDGDGRPDLYVSNMWTAAGQRVTSDPAFHPASGDAEAWRRHTRGNSLYRNRGDGTFADAGAHERVEMGRWAWSSGGFDFDLDGIPEILVATGMVTNDSKRDLSSFFWRQVVARTPRDKASAPAYETGWNALNQLIREGDSWNGHEPNVFLVRRDGRYRDASGVSGLDFAEDTRTFAVTDFDGDGVPDLILKSRLGPQLRAMRNESSGNRPAIAIALQGVNSNRDGIGARVEVNGQVQYLAAGSGFLSQHSKRLHFGLAARPLAQVRIVWPSGEMQTFADLSPGAVYTITEGNPQPVRTAFRPSTVLSSGVLSPNNRPELTDTWLLRPVPTPQRHQGPVLLVLYAGSRPAVPAGLPVEAFDLAAQPDDVAATWSIFHRYLLEYRAPLQLPAAFLLDEQGRARKLYTAVPPESRLRQDLASLNRSAELALPFPGRYVLEPVRNYFKMGAAFYWAGYPDRALPYLEETVRARPDNWKALLALGRIEMELERYDAAAGKLQRVVAMRPSHAPAIVDLGQAYAKLGDKTAARRAFLQALEADPGCADAANHLGLLAAEANDAADARQWFQKAIAAQRDHSGAINNLGVLYAKLGQSQDSIAAFLYGIDVSPDDEQLYLNLARIYVTLGQREKARDILNRLLGRKADNPVATRALAELESR